MLTLAFLPVVTRCYGSVGCFVVGFWIGVSFLGRSWTPWTSSRFTFSVHNLISVEKCKVNEWKVPFLIKYHTYMVPWSLVSFGKFLPTFDQQNASVAYETSSGSLLDIKASTKEIFIFFCRRETRTRRLRTTNATTATRAIHFWFMRAKH